MKNVWNEILKQEEEIKDHNDSILNSIGDCHSDFDDLISDCHVSGKIEIVDEPCGTIQDEDCGVFMNVHVDQNGGGYTGDDFAGEIYAQIPDGRWLKIPYYC